MINNKVEPKEIDNWLEKNKQIVHTNTLKLVRKYVDTRPENQVILMMTFEWEDEVYAKLYAHLEVIPETLKNAEDYFVENDMFELAIEARDLQLAIEEIIADIL